ncbi:UNVERIFIED_ORG: hypothetical protein GGR78_003744 [Xanthomonas campestris]
MVGWVTSGLLAFSRSMAVLRCTPSQPARPCPGPRLRRGRSKARAPSCPSSSLRERCLKASLSFFETFSGHGNNVQSGSVAGDWRRAAHGCAAAASQTGCLPSRGADPRPRCRPHRSDYRQASCSPYPHPTPSSRWETGVQSCRVGARRNAHQWRASCAFSPAGRAIGRFATNCQLLIASVSEPRWQSMLCGFTPWCCTRSFQLARLGACLPIPTSFPCTCAC